MFTDEIPPEKYYGTGVAVSIPKKKWEKIMPEDLEKARPQIEKNDIVMINTGWQHKYFDSVEYFCYSLGLYKEAGEWLAAKGVRCVGVDQQARDHPLATAIGPHGPGPLRPDGASPGLQAGESRGSLARADRERLCCVQFWKKENQIEEL